MSWTKAISRAKDLIQSRVGAEAPKAADADLPMQAKIGGLITFKVSPFLRAGNPLVKTPEQFARIVSISRLRAPMPGAVHRFYVSRGDHGARADGSDNERFLQVYTDEAGEVQEIVYFERLMRLVPADEAELNAYRGVGGVGLGCQTFSLFREQLSALGLAPARLNVAFDAEEQLAYTRCIGSEDQEFVTPIRGVENRIDDSEGRQGLRQEVVFMPYKRTLAGGGDEQLLISTETVRDRNGDSQAEDIHVDFMIGLVLTKNDVTVQ